MGKAAWRPAGYALAFGWFLLDQLSKWIVAYPLGLPDRASIELLPVFRLIWVENHGVSMGFLVAGCAAERWLLTLLTAGIAVAVAVWASCACGSCCEGVATCWAAVPALSSPPWSPDMMPPLPLIWRVFARRRRQELRRPLFSR